MQDRRQATEEGEDEAKNASELKPNSGTKAQSAAENAETARADQQQKKALEEEKKKSEDYLTRLKYLQAEFENFRKRIDREIQEVEEFSTSGFARRLLPVMDELDLAISSAESSKSPLTEGLKMVRKNLSGSLEAEGVRKIEALGKPFDPTLHEAVDKVQGKRNEEDLVIEEIRKGYTFKGRVLRPSMVKVELSGKEKTEKNEKRGGQA